VDLLVARNTLMYFNAETQVSVIRRFHFALAYPGYLFLGKAEMLLNHADHFEAVDLRKRLFRKTSPTPMIASARTGTVSRDPAWSQLNGAALSSGPVVQLAVDRAGQLTGQDRAAVAGPARR
jgi:two-component system, chemotaxis family, CheB/CheR fusion protein